MKRVTKEKYRKEQQETFFFELNELQNEEYEVVNVESSDEVETRRVSSMVIPGGSTTLPVRE